VHSTYRAGLLLLSVSVAMAADREEPVNLPDFPVRAAATPIVKVDLPLRLRVARYGAALAADGRYLYVVGGANTYGQCVGEIERIDLERNTSEIVARLTIPRRNHRVAIANGQLYVLGGYRGSSIPSARPFEDSVEIIDLTSGTTRAGVPMPIAKANFGCTAIGNRLYVFGGAKFRNGHIVDTNSVEIFDLGQQRWATGLTMPTARECAATTVTGFALVAGGTRSRKEVRDVAVYIPAENIWRILPPLHRATATTSATFAGHHVLLFGESVLIAYDLKTKRSEPFALDYQVARGSAAIAHDGRIYVVGGQTSGELDLDDFRVASPTVTLGPNPSPAEDYEEFIEARHNLSLAATHVRPPSGAERAERDFTIDDTALATTAGTLDFAGSKDYGAIDAVQVFTLRATPGPVIGK
jgi:hypothetical protein